MTGSVDNRRSAQVSRPRECRRGIQLLELVISLTTSSILVAGISAAVFMSTRGKELADRGKSEAQLWMALDRFTTDVAEAKEFFSCTDQSVTFQVADRDGDNVDELLEYSWTPGGALQYTHGSAGTPIDITQPLDDLTMRWRTSTPQTEDPAESFDPVGQYIYQSHRSRWKGDGGFFNFDSGFDNTVTIPETYMSGDLLVAAITVATAQTDEITANASWNKTFQVEVNNISFAVFTTYSPSGGSVTFDWPDKGRSYAVVAHFQSPGASGFLDDFATSTGTSNSPAAPAATAAHANSLIVRVLGTRQSSSPEDAANMPDHMPIFFRSGVSSRPLVGMAVRSQVNAGGVPSANFSLGSSQNHVAATLVFAP